MSRSNNISRLLVAFSLAAIAILTLYPDPGTATSSWQCVFCGSRATADLVLNILLFAPLGVGLCLAQVQRKNALAVALMVSGAVEVAQLIIPGRDASLGDLVSNALGCWLGYSLTLKAPHWLAPRTGLVRWLAPGAALLAAAVVVTSGAMLQPTFTQSTYYGQWTPNLGHLDWYRGRVLQATVGDNAVPSGRLDDSETIRTSLRDGSPITVRAVAGETTTRLSSLLSLADANENMIVLIGPIRDRLLYLFRIRGESFRLDRPALGVSGIMDLTPGDTIEISSSRSGREYCLSFNQDMYCGLGFTTGSGWALLWYDESVPLGFQMALNVAWMCVLLIPLGLWIRPNLESAIGGVIVVTAILWAPALTGLRPTPLIEWLGAAAGVATGGLLGALAQRFLGRRTHAAPSGYRGGRTRQVTFCQRG